MQQDNQNIMRVMAFSALVVRYGFFKAILIWLTTVAILFVAFFGGLIWIVRAMNVSP